MSEYHGGNTTIAERQEMRREADERRAMKEARDKWASQGFIKRSLSTPDNFYRKPSSGYGGFYDG